MTMGFDGTNGVTFPDASVQPVAFNASGMVAFFAMQTPPSGWLAANGAAVSRTTYATLFAAIGTTYGAGDGSTTFNLPNMGGRFPRGWISGQTTDSGRVFGSLQTDAFQGHRHDFTGYAGSNGDNFLTMVGYSAAVTLRTANTNAGVRDAITDGTNGTPRTAAETRPVNVALLACIKT